MPKTIENLWTRHVIARDRLYYVVFFTFCAQTVDLVFIYIFLIVQFQCHHARGGKKSTARNIKIQ